MSIIALCAIAVLALTFAAIRRASTSYYNHQRRMTSRARATHETTGDTQ